MTAVEKMLAPAEIVAMFAAKGLRISERELRRKARELGCCRELGKALFFLPEDIDALFGGLQPCRSKSQGEKARHSGTSSGNSTALGTTEVLALLERKMQKPSGTASRRKHGNVVSMASHRT